MLLEIAIPVPLPRTFTYSHETPLEPGVRVLVPFGRQKFQGVVLGPGNLPPQPNPSANASTSNSRQKRIDIRPILSVLDDAPVFSPLMLDLGRWLSQYYLYPLGEVYRTMLPASTIRGTKTLCRLNCHPILWPDPHATSGPELLRRFWEISPDEELPLDEARLRFKPFTKDFRALGIASFGALVKREIIITRKARGHSSRGSTSPLSERAAPLPPTDTPPDLTPAQRHVLDAIVRDGLHSSAPRKPFLLHGVTGSGKTEIYLHLISHLAADEQALVLVPEISLTPQITDLFNRRFPGRVAVVHSAMADTDRWSELDRIRHGDAKILIGPRSAVFGPFKRLALILVDEEHDHSYKQATGLTYHGRDTAVLRAQRENATIVLGSATPSLESFHNARQGKYHYLELRERVGGRPLPDIATWSAPSGFGHGIAMNETPARGSGGAFLPIEAQEAEIPLHPDIALALNENYAAGQQSIVLVNRRGYAYYMYSMTRRETVSCPHCSISLTVHRRSRLLRCHYCDYQTSAERVIAERAGEQFVAIGYGAEKAEDALRQAVPGARIQRLDSDMTADRDVLPDTLARFRREELDILVGTQILAKGHDFPKVTLIVILEADQVLNLPDFRAGERTFQLLVQASGRAGRAGLRGRVMIQSVHPGHPVVQAAIQQNYELFANRELDFRAAQHYPPFSRMIAVEFNGPDAKIIRAFASDIERWMERLSHEHPQLTASLRILGPTAPPIEIIRGRTRRQLLFIGETQRQLREVVTALLNAFPRLPKDVRMRVDVDPQSLL
jgi:primosomal protein N' (replication factor Y)